MTYVFAKATALRALAVASVVGMLPVSAVPAHAGALSDCYDYIMSACPDSLTEYGQCINEGFGLCDNQHPEPLHAGALDLDFLPADQRRVVRDILRERGVPARVYRTPVFFGSSDDEDGRSGASAAGSR